MSKPSKKELIEKIKEQNCFTQEEKTELIGLLNKRKRYGLVWEDKPEEAEELLKENLPLLQEVKERAIINDDSAATPNHILIEGDNLHALTSLCFTHEGKVDVIYIDPPYNTGNKDFKYNDSYVDSEDTFRHSKYLCFIQKRLKIAKQLLKDTGVIYISIDDNEMAQLKLLCDDVFGEGNHIATNIWEKIHSVKNDAKYLSENHEYLLFYAKNISQVNINLLTRTSEMNARYKNPDNDPRGVWQSGDLAANETRKDGNYEVINPKTGKSFFVPAGKHWVYSKENMETLIKEDRIWFGKKGDAFPRKKRFLNEVADGRKGTTLWFSEEVGHNQEGKRELKNFFEQSENLFTNPKPTRLIARILELSSDKSSVILDFFAGSGTTLQTTVSFNKEDKGTRQCILVTNNENKIAEEICYERSKRVIDGYTKPNGEKVEGLKENNLRYFKTEMVSRATTLKNKRQITQLSTDLLRIKENCYSEIKNKELGAKSAELRVFSQNGKTFMVVYDDMYIPKAVEAIKALDGDIKVYVFAEGQEPYREDFEDVLDRVVLCALPDAIYKAYQHVLPKQKKEIEKLMI